MGISVRSSNNPLYRPSWTKKGALSLLNFHGHLPKFLSLHLFFLFSIDALREIEFWRMNYGELDSRLRGND